MDTKQIYHLVKIYKGYQIVEVSRNATTVWYEVRKIIINNIDEDVITELNTLSECTNFIDNQIKEKIMEKISTAKTQNHSSSSRVFCKRCEARMDSSKETHSFDKQTKFTLLEYRCPDCKSQIDSVIIHN